MSDDGSSLFANERIEGFQVSLFKCMYSHLVGYIFVLILILRSYFVYASSEYSDENAPMRR